MLRIGIPVPGLAAVWEYASNGTHFLHQDSLGSATTVTDSAGAVYQDKLYYPWGQQWALVGTEAETMFARLHTRDTETGLDPTHFRMFSSTEGRWMSTDPAKGCGDKPQNLNRYAYAGNQRASPNTLKALNSDGVCKRRSRPPRMSWNDWTMNSISRMPPGPSFT